MKRNPSRKNTSVGPGGGAHLGSDTSKLRQQLVHAKSQIAILEEELQEQNTQYLNAIKERDAGAEKLRNAKESLSRFEALVKQSVDRAMAEERKANAAVRAREAELQQKVTMLEEARPGYEAKIQSLKDQLEEYQANAKQGANQTMGSTKTEELRAQMLKKDKEMDKLTKHINYLQDQMEDFMAENKQLRDNFSLPANFGIDRENVKLLDREKIDDYKKLVRVLQEDNYHLEQERANLKHRLKQQSMMVNCEVVDQRYAHYKLTQAQWSDVDRFVWDLHNNETTQPADFYEIKKENEILKAKIEVHKDKDFEKVRGQMEDAFKELTKEGGNLGGMSEDQFVQIKAGYDEVKQKLNELVAQGINVAKAPEQPGMAGIDISGTSTFKGGNTMMNQTNQLSQMMLPTYMLPPRPNQNADGSINTGYSHRFDANLPVTGREGEKHVDKQDIDNAFLQLQLLECFEMTEKKDEIMKAQKREVDSLYARIKKYILMQDHLYKDYVKLERKHEELQKNLTLEAQKDKEQLRNEQIKVRDLENLVKQLEVKFDKDRQTEEDKMKKRLIELTKQNTMLEVNMIQMTRKYQNLTEKEQMTRRNNEMIGVQMSEMEVECVERINELKAWKRNAIFQMKQCYEQLKTAYPLAEYESLQKELEIYKKKNGDLIVRNKEYADQISDLQAKQRKVTDEAQRQKDRTAYNEDLEREFNELGRRLEKCDEKYRWEQALLKRMVQKLKRTKVSILKAFQLFDTDGDGHLSRKEMADAIAKLGFDDLSLKEVECIIDSMDTDKNGQIEYKEFDFKLQRCGLKAQTTEETLVFNIIKTIQRMKTQKTQVFELIDKEGKGYITRLDFKDFLSQLKVDEINDDDIENFINHFYKEETGDINLQSFLRIFNRYEDKMNAEEQGEQQADVMQKRKRPIIAKATLERKKAIWEEVNKALRECNGNLRQIFNKIDTDRSNAVDLPEFRKMFELMDVELHDSQTLDIFKSIDIDNSGAIDWAELQYDFQNCLAKGATELWEEERQAHQDQNEDDDDLMRTFGTAYPAGQDMRATPGVGMSSMKEMDLQRKIASLENKLAQAYQELTKENALKELNNQSLNLLQRHHDDLRKQYTYAKDEVFNLELKIKQLEEKIRASISKVESEKIQKQNVALGTELRETKSALLSYKNLHNVVCEQVKSLKLLNERKKDENESLHQTLRELSAESIEKSRLDKLRYVVMLSRWQEAAVNKKYNMKQTECDELRTIKIEQEREIQYWEKEHEKIQQEIQDVISQNHELKKQLQQAKNMFLPLSKAEDFDRVISKITDERDQLEEKYFKVRSEYTTALNMRDDLLVKVEEYKDTLKKLENSKQSELANQIIKMSDKFQKMRIASMKAERKAAEAQEVQAHLEKLLQIKRKEISELEEKYAKIEKELTIKEQNWRKVDNERIKQWFQVKLREDKEKQIIGHQKAGLRPASQFSQRSNQMSLQDGQRPKTAAESIRDEEIEKLQEQLAKLQDENNFLQNQNKQLGLFKQEDLRTLGDGQSQAAQDFNDQMLKIEKLNRDEKEEIYEAAQQTIKTLNEMLEHKKSQLSSKEQQIEKLRDDILQQRQRHAEKVKQLEDQIYNTGQSTLAKLHEYVGNHVSEGERSGMLSQQAAAQRETKASEAKVELANRELKNLRDQLDGTLEDIDHIRSQAGADKRALQSQVEQQDAEIQNLQAKMRLEKDKRKDLARSRLQKNDELYKKFELKMLEQEKQILKLQDQNEVMKMREKTSKTVGVNEKIAVISSSTDQQAKLLQEQLEKKNEEIRKLREKELKAKASNQQISNDKNEAEQKLMKEKEKYMKGLEDKKDLQERHDRLQEKFKNLKYEFEEIKDDNRRFLSEKQGTGVGSGMSYAQLEEKIKELESDNFILQKQSQPMIHANPKTQAFEYIGEPLPLSQEKQVESIDEVLQGIAKWTLKSGNDRLSVGRIFQAMDMYGYEELSQDQFSAAMAKIGIALKANELSMLQKHLAKDSLGKMQYMTMVRQLQGIPQQDFMNKGINKLAAVVENRDLVKSDFQTKLVDPKNISTMTLDQLQDAFKACRHRDFQFDEREVADIFRHITKSKNTMGIKINIQDLTKSVYESVKGLLLEKMRLSLLKNDLNLNQLFTKYDRNRDDVLDAKEFEKALGDCGLEISPNLSVFLNAEVFDPLAAKQRRNAKISKKVLRKYLECHGAMGSRQVKVRDQPMEATTNFQGADMDEPSPSKFSGAGGLSPEQEAQSKITSRKILAKLHSNLVEIVCKLDHLEEGIVNKAELNQTLLDSKVPDLAPEELNNLLKSQDKGQKGYIAASKFIDNIYELASESESDGVLRRIANSVAHQGTNLKEHLREFDSQDTGTLEKAQLKKGLRQCSIAVSDNELDILFKEMGRKMKPRTDGLDADGMGSLKKRKDQSAQQRRSQPATKELIDIGKFVASINLIGKSKPLPGYVLQGPKGGQKQGGRQGQAASGNMMAGFEAEKKYKKNLEALKHEIEEKNREIEAFQKEVADCRRALSKLDQEKKQLEATLINKQQKPPKETSNESLAVSQAQELMQVKDQLFYQQEENTKLKKMMQVTLKAEISKLTVEKDQLDEKYKDKIDENQKLQNQIQRLFARPMDNIEKREELELQKQLKINDLDDEVQILTKEKEDLQEELFKAHETNLSLKFEKETYDLQYARLQKRIQELDQYKEKTSNMSAILRKQEEDEMADINEATGKTLTANKKKKDSNVFRQRSTQSVSELEMLVESLKRVIEKLKIENEHLKKENNKHSGVGDKINSEKALRQKISNLETLVQSYEMKDVNLDERERTIKKLIDANKQLRDDLHREVDRYTLLEGKYKGVLVKHNILNRENMKNEEMIFSTMTGTNIRRYDNYLADNNEHDY